MSFEHRDWCECNSCDCDDEQRKLCIERILGDDYAVFRCIKCCGQTERLSRGVESLEDIEDTVIDHDDDVEV